MKADTKKKLAAEIEATNFFNELPAEIRGYTLTKIFDERGDKFIYFTYTDENAHRALIVYFHNETAEYKVRLKIGLTEFCLTNFFTRNFDRFIDSLKAKLDAMIKNLNERIDIENDLFIGEKNFGGWTYAKTLPKNLEGFELFIAPDNPVKITNGSYIILNYSDFENQSDFTIFYNIFTDSYSGESRIKLVPRVSYLFDAKNLDELQIKLKQNLAEELQSIRNF